MEDIFETELKELINKHGKDNEVSMPDYILAGILNDCLKAISKANIRMDVHLHNQKEQGNGR